MENTFFVRVTHLSISIAYNLAQPKHSVLSWIESVYVVYMFVIKRFFNWLL